MGCAICEWGKTSDGFSHVVGGKSESLEEEIKKVKKKNPQLNSKIGE